MLANVGMQLTSLIKLTQRIYFRKLNFDHGYWNLKTDGEDWIKTWQDPAIARRLQLLEDELEEEEIEELRMISEKMKKGEKVPLEDLLWKYLSKDAVKFLKKLEKSNKSEKEKILRKIKLLDIDPFLGKKLKGVEWFPIRIGEYRVIYEIHTDIGEVGFEDR